MNTGADLVYWERKLPVISNRDYVFSRHVDGETEKSLNQMFDDLTPPTTPMKGGGMRSAADFLSPSTSKNNKSVYFSITKGMESSERSKIEKSFASIRITQRGKSKPFLISRTRMKCAA